MILKYKKTNLIKKNGKIEKEDKTILRRSLLRIKKIVKKLS